MSTRNTRFGDESQARTNATARARRESLAGKGVMILLLVNCVVTGAARAEPLAAPSGGPIHLVLADGKVMEVKPTLFTTPSFRSTTVQLGRELVTAGSEAALPIDSLRPIVVLAEATGPWSPYMHDGYELSIVIGAIKFVPGERLQQWPVFTIPAPTRQFKPGGSLHAGEGIRQFDFFPDGYSALIFFENVDDPLSAGVLKRLPDQGKSWLSRPRPRPYSSAPRGVHETLDREKDVRRGAAFALYLAQMGPKGWGAELDYYDPTKYVMVLDLDANAVIPSHWHNGWSAVGIIDGTVAIAGVEGTSGSLMVFEPLARQSLKAGPKGSTVVLFFDSGQAAFPHWDVPDDQRALQFNRALRVPAGLP